MAYARLERAFVGRSQVVKGVAGGPAGLTVGALAGLARLRRLHSLYVRLLRLVRIRWPAGRRCGAGASSALQMPAMSGTRHQSEARPHANGLTRNELSQFSRQLGQHWDSANPVSMRLSQCPQLSQSKTRQPEARAVASTRMLCLTAGNLMGWRQRLAGWRMAGHPSPLLGPSWTSPDTGLKEREIAVACGLQIS